jgi:PmbA protein
MMENLLGMAKRVCDRAEIYLTESTENSVSFENAKLHDIDSKFQSGISLRVIKDGRLGFAYTRNLVDREEFLQNAIDSLKGGARADYGFPFTKDIPGLDTYNPSVETLSNARLMDEGARVSDLLKSRTDGEISVTSFMSTQKTRIINSEGTDLSDRSTLCGTGSGVIYPGTGSGLRRIFKSKGFEETPDELLNEIIDLYRLSSNVVKPKSGKMKAIFMPNSMLALNWRLKSGTSSKSVYENTSPIAEKLGQKIFDEKLTIYDDPLNDMYPGARSFDDEGVACQPLTIIEKGVLKSFYYDLDNATKLNAQSTGHGYKGAMWGGDSISLKPQPSLAHMSLKTGGKSFSELVKLIDRGIILEGALGAHSGNIPNGDYSIGVNPGLYVENGEIIGRVKGVMAAGNVYETLKHVVEIGDTQYPCAGGGWMPPVLFDNVSFSAKK